MSFHFISFQFISFLFISSHFISFHLNHSFHLVLLVSMHLVRMSRSSSFSRRRPRHLFDLPDEILRLILAYCCENLDFLLWSCPLVLAEGQLCHDCYHCTLCHGPVVPSSLHSTSISMFASQHTHNSYNRGNPTRNDSKPAVFAQIRNTEPTRSNSQSFVTRINNSRYIHHSHARANAMDSKENSSHSAHRKTRRRMSRSQGVVLDTADGSMARQPICPQGENHRHNMQHYSHYHQHTFRISSLLWWRRHPYNRPSIPRPLATFLTSFTTSISVPYYALAALVTSSHPNQTQRDTLLAQVRTTHFSTRITGKRPSAQFLNPAEI